MTFPRMRWRGEGLWVHSGRGATLHRWRHLLPPLLLLPAVLAVASLLALNRQSWALAPLLSPAARQWVGAANGGQAARFTWESLLAHNQRALENLFAADPPPATSDLPTVDLWMEGGARRVLERSLAGGDPALGREPGGRKPYVPAWVRQGPGLPIQRCRAAYRGHKAAHHWAAKPSFRVRLSKARASEGRRYVELQRPEDVLLLANALPEALGRELGLLTNLSDPVRVTLNRKHLGVYLRTYRPGTPLAQAQGRLPGTFLKGDNLQAPGLPHQPGILWRDPRAWRTSGEDPAPALELLARLLPLAARARELSPAELREAYACVDTDRFARWAALMALCGGANVDAEHNHVWFLNSYHGRLEPVVWDVSGFAQPAQLLPVDYASHPLLELLYRDPAWVHRRNRYLAELLAGPAAPEALAAWISAHLERVGPDLRADPNLAFIAGRTQTLVPCSVRDIPARRARLERWLHTRRQLLRTYLDLAWVQVTPAGPGRSRVVVTGSVGVRVRRGEGPARLLLPALGGRAPVLHPAPRAYELAGSPGELRCENAVTGGKVERGRPRPFQPTLSLSSAALGAPAPLESSLGPGEVLLERDLVLEAHQVLRVAPGTRLRLAPGVGIYARGRVEFAGSPEAPIRVEPAGDAPWACIGLSGPETAGSRFAHVALAGGSVGERWGVRFKGMLSAYECPSIRLEGCRFGPNRVGDDAVNLAQAQVDIRACVWTDARSDGLDLDRCRGLIRACRFEGAGNDGLDLMTSRVRIEDSVFTGCGDKGLSVGEASRALLRGCRVEACRLGIEAKDASLVVLEETRLRGNGVGLHAYAKKWNFGHTAGAFLLVDSRVEASRLVGASLKPPSLAVLVGSVVEGPEEATRGRLRELGEAPAAWQGLRASLEELAGAGPL